MSFGLIFDYSYLSFRYKGIRKMNTIRRIISAIAVILILISAEGADTLAAETKDHKPENIHVQAGSLVVESESSDYFRYENGTLYIYGGTVSVRTSPAVEYASDRIEVSGYACLVLDGVRIRPQEGAAVRVLPGAEAEIRLDGSDPVAGSGETDEYDRITENYLEGAEGCAGIEAGTLSGGEGGYFLAANLRINGDGYLTVVGGEGAAAIGSGRGQNACGVIVIEEGNIRAVAGREADAVGCGADSVSDPLSAPMIKEDVTEFSAFSDGTGRTIAPAAAADGLESEESGDAVRDPEKVAAASMLTAVFSESEEENLAGLQNVRVRDTVRGYGQEFSMPEGYREFSIKVDADCEYTIEQGGRIFAGSRPEEETEDDSEDDETMFVFKGTLQADSHPQPLAPMEKAPAFDLDVQGHWEDEDDTDGIRPESFTVTLYANGKETGRTITLSEDNDWTGTFEELPLYADAVRQSYSVVEEGIDGYTGMIGGCDSEGYEITNMHEPFPEGRSAEEEIAERSGRPFEEGRIVATVLTTKITRTTPARTSTTIKKSRSAKTADSSGVTLWGGILLAAIIALLIWVHFEQKKA